VSFFIDRRTTGDRSPGLHALIVGISDYEFLPGIKEPKQPYKFGLQRVDGPAVSAWRIAQALLNPPDKASWVRPLATITLLLLPSAADIKVAPDIDLALKQGKILKATRDNFSDAVTQWVGACENSDQDVSFFYFAGHGLRHDDLDCLVCADFGEKNGPGMATLRRCLTFDSIWATMNGPRANLEIARQQFWFVDCCRVKAVSPDENKIGEPETVDTPGRAEDGKPMERFGLFSTQVAIQAIAITDEGDTPFGSALVKALTQAVGRPTQWPVGSSADVWPIGAREIYEATIVLLGRDPKTKGQKPQFAPGTGGTPEILLAFDISHPPSINATIQLRPPNTPDKVTAWTLRRIEGPPPEPIDSTTFHPYPYSAVLPAGNYEVTCTFASGEPIRRSWLASLTRDEFNL
jgi:hypothetical protein